VAGLFDVVIIGGGPAGLAAGIYAARARLAAVLIEKAFPGGQVLTADLVENFPGFPEGIGGMALAELLVSQARAAGLETRTAEVKQLTVEKDGFHIIIDKGEILSTRSLIIATGAAWNALNVPGEEDLRGRGVSYCATCDGPLFRDREVVVVGGGDTAVGDALFLAKFAKKVTIVHRRDALRAAKVLQERVRANEKIEVRWNSIVVRIEGRSRVTSVVLKNVSDQTTSTLPCDGVFVLVGVKPNSELVKGIVDTDASGSIVTDGDMRTSRQGIFACGDVRKKILRQIVTACGEGAAAAFSAQHYLEGLRSR